MKEFLLVEADERAPQRLRRKALDTADALIASLDHRDANAIHAARRRLKELRALTSLLRDALPGGGKGERKFFRDAGRELAVARDAKAALEAFDRLRERFASEWKPKQFQKVRRALAARVHAEVEQSVVDNLRQALVVERGRIAAWPVDDMRRDELWLALARSYRRTRRGMRRAVEERTVEAIHEWRKRVKMHAYEAQFLTEVKITPLEPRLDALQKLSRTLGHYHDLVLIDEICRRSPELLGSSRYVKEFQTFIARALADLFEKAERDGSELFRDPTGTWIDSVRQSASDVRTRIGPKKMARRARTRSEMLA